MIADKIFSFKNIAWIALLAMFFSCENATKQKEAPQGKIPYAQTEDFQLIYTDSAKVKAILTSNLSLDYSNQKFAYQEFPQGLVLDLFDEQARKNTIKSHYAIYYLPTQMVELRDSVVLMTHVFKILKSY